MEAIAENFDLKLYLIAPCYPVGSTANSCMARPENDVFFQLHVFKSNVHRVSARRVLKKVLRLKIWCVKIST